MGKKKPCSVNKGDDFMLKAVITAELLQLTKKQLHATQPHLSYKALRNTSLVMKIFVKTTD